MCRRGRRRYNFIRFLDIDVYLITFHNRNGDWNKFDDIFNHVIHIGKWLYDERK